MINLVLMARTNNVCENRWLRFVDEHREGLKSMLVTVT